MNTSFRRKAKLMFNDADVFGIMGYVELGEPIGVCFVHTRRIAPGPREVHVWDLGIAKDTSDGHYEWIEREVFRRKPSWKVFFKTVENLASNYLAREVIEE